MNEALKQKIAFSHAIASAMQMIVAFSERSEFLGGPLEVDEAIAELARQNAYGVSAGAMWTEYNRLRAL
jgi:amino acid permease